MSRIYWNAEEKSKIVTDIVTAMIEKKQTPRDLELHNRLLLRHLRNAQRSLETCRRRDTGTLSAIPWLLPAIATDYQKTIAGISGTLAQPTVAVMPVVKADSSPAPIPAAEPIEPTEQIEPEDSLEDLAAGLARALVRRYTRFLESNGATAQQDLVSSILLLTESVTELRTILKPEVVRSATPETPLNGHAANGHTNGHATNGNGGALHILEQAKETRQKPKVVIFGLEKGQMNVIEQGFGSTYKLYFKKGAQPGDMPQADLVILTRFMRHAVTDMTKNMYDKDIVHWVGGISDIQALLRSKKNMLVNRQPMLTADAAS